MTGIELRLFQELVTNINKIANLDRIVNNLDRISYDLNRIAIALESQNEANLPLGFFPQANKESDSNE